MAQQDRESARSASMHEAAWRSADPLRAAFARGENNETRAFVLGEVEQLPEMTVLAIELDFDPCALVETLQSRGNPAHASKTARRSWSLIVQPAGSPPILDLSDLEAPLPLESILEAVSELDHGASLFARTPCFPRPLLAQLDQRNLDWQAVEEPGGTGLVWVGKPG